MSEVEQLRAQQIKVVMPLIGGLLDAWDNLPLDVREDDELEHLRDYIKRIDAGMEEIEDE